MYKNYKYIVEAVFDIDAEDDTIFSSPAKNNNFVPYDTLTADDMKGELLNRFKLKIEELTGKKYTQQRFEKSFSVNFNNYKSEMIAHFLWGAKATPDITSEIFYYDIDSPEKFEKSVAFYNENNVNTSEFANKKRNVIRLLNCDINSQTDIIMNYLEKFADKTCPKFNILQYSKSNFTNKSALEDLILKLDKFSNHKSNSIQFSFSSVITAFPNFFKMAEFMFNAALKCTKHKIFIDVFSPAFPTYGDKTLNLVNNKIFDIYKSKHESFYSSGYTMGSEEKLTIILDDLKNYLIKNNLNTTDFYTDFEKNILSINKSLFLLYYHKNIIYSYKNILKKTSEEEIKIYKDFIKKLFKKLGVMLSEDELNGNNFDIKLYFPKSRDSIMNIEINYSNKIIIFYA